MQQQQQRLQEYLCSKEKIPKLIYANKFENKNIQRIFFARKTLHKEFSTCDFVKSAILKEKVDGKSQCLRFSGSSHPPPHVARPVSSLRAKIFILSCREVSEIFYK